MTPFVVFALPRSRTMWTARFLSYRDWVCGHDESAHLRSPEDVRAWLSMPLTGVVDTAAAPFWRTLMQHRPDARVVTIRRDVEPCIKSLLKLGVPEAARPTMTKLLENHQRKLDQIEHRIPGVLSVTFDELATEAGCRKLWAHCLPYDFDAAWWSHLKDKNIQIHWPHLCRYINANHQQIMKGAAQLKMETLAHLAKRRERALPDRDDLELSSVSFDEFLSACPKLFEQHEAKVGHHPDAWRLFNMPFFRAMDSVGNLQCVLARSNGRVFGYMVSIVSPALDDGSKTVAMHTTYYADPNFNGVGRRIEDYATKLLRERGVDELVLRAGPVGDGPRMGRIFQRQGAEDHGHLYLRKLKD